MVSESIAHAEPIRAQGIIVKYTPIDKPLKFSAHKHRSQRWSQKKIDDFMLSGCVLTWFASTTAGTNPNLGRYFYTCLKALNDWSRGKHFIYFPAEGNFEAPFSWVPE